MLSTAIRKVGGDIDTVNHFSCLDLTILPENNGNLYDILDATVWEEDAEEVDTFLSLVADVFTLQLKGDDDKSKTFGIDIPSDLYLDRYTEPFLPFVKEMKKLRDETAIQIAEIEAKERKLKLFSLEGSNAKTHDMLKLMEATTRHFSKPFRIETDNEDDLHMQGQSPVQQDITPILREITARILKKLGGMESE